MAYFNSSHLLSYAVASRLLAQTDFRSAANIERFSSQIIARSVMYRRNGSGPRTNLGGPPRDAPNSHILSFSTVKHKDLFIKKSDTQFNTKSPNPKDRDICHGVSYDSVLFGPGAWGQNASLSMFVRQWAPCTSKFVDNWKHEGFLR